MQRSTLLSGFAWAVACCFTAARGTPAWSQTRTVVGQTPRMVITRGEGLVASREAYRRGDAEVRGAVQKLVRQAGQQLTSGNIAVTDKRVRLPANVSPHDYFSLSPYWWPDPAKPDGLPYIRRDGETNPESKQDLDQPRVSALGERVQTLALAWWFSGEARYAEQAVSQIRTWFIDSSTRMTPHLRHSQLVRGIDAERGSGIIDSRPLIEVVDAIGLLEQSPAWTSADDRAVREWFRAYLTWLVESPNGQAEHEARNNHGSWYAAQVVSYAHFLGDTATVRRIAGESEARIAWQFDSAGKQAEEFARTRSFHYSNFNLEALSRVAEVARTVGVNLWSFTAPSGASILRGLQFMAPFVDATDKWPGEQLDAVNRSDLLRTFRRAAVATREPSVTSIAKNLATGAQATDRWIVLFYPAGR